jgi:hypothetical protein
MFRSLQPGRCLSMALGVDTRCPGSSKSLDIPARRSQVFLSGSNSCPSMRRSDTLKTGPIPSSTAYFPEDTLRGLRLKEEPVRSARSVRAADVVTGDAKMRARKGRPLFNSSNGSLQRDIGRRLSACLICQRSACRPQLILPFSLLAGVRRRYFVRRLWANGLSLNGFAMNLSVSGRIRCRTP